MQENGQWLQLTKNLVPPLFATHSKARGIISSSYVLHASSTSLLERLPALALFDSSKRTGNRDVVSRMDWLPPIPLFEIVLVSPGHGKVFVGFRKNLPSWHHRMYGISHNQDPRVALLNI
jgi:hypothetical protein